MRSPPKVLFRALVILATITPLARSQVATESKGWPMFMHDAQHTGATADMLPLRPLKVRWSVKFWEWTHVWSQPVIAGNDLYLGMMDGVLVNLDASTGKEKWRHQADGAIAVTPCIAGELLIYGDFSGKIVAVNRASGQKVWTVQTDGPIYSSPTFEDGRVFVGSNDANLYCLSAADGRKLWTFAAGEMIYSAPAYYDGLVYFASEDMFAYAVGASDGALAWKKKLYGPCNRSNHPWVAAAAGKVVFCSASNADGEAGHSQKSTIFMSVPKSEVATALGKPAGSNVGHWQITGQPDKVIELSIGVVKQRPELQAYYVLDLKTGREMRDFKFIPSQGQPIVSPYIPLVGWYNNGARGVLTGGKLLWIQDECGLYRVDLTNGEFRLDSRDGHSHRGDEFTSLTATNGFPIAGFMNYVGAYSPEKRQRIELLNHSNNSFWYQVPLPPPQLSIWPIDHPEGWKEGMDPYLKKDDQAMKEGRAQVRAIRWGHFYTGLGTGYGGGACYGQLIIANGLAYYPVAGNFICFEPEGGR